MAQSKVNPYLHERTCKCHDTQAERCRTFTNINRKNVLVYALAALLVLSGAFTPVARGKIPWGRSFWRQGSIRRREARGSG
jgi:hypothetical protein